MLGCFNRLYVCFMNGFFFRNTTWPLTEGTEYLTNINIYWYKHLHFAFTNYTCALAGAHRLTSWLTDWLTDWRLLIADYLTAWWTDWLEWITEWVTDRLPDWLTDWLTDWRIDCLTDGLSTNPLTPKFSLLILLTVCQIVLVMLVQRIWFWIN